MPLVKITPVIAEETGHYGGQLTFVGPSREAIWKHFHRMVEQDEVERVNYE